MQRKGIYMQNIINYLKNNIPNFTNPTHYIIQGGYFETSVGIDEFSKTSYENALFLGNLLQNINNDNRVESIILANNINQDCQNKKCDISNIQEDDRNLICKNIASLRKNSSLNGAFVNIVKESHMKNKGLRKIKKLLKKNILKETFHDFYYVDTGTKKQCYYKSSSNDDILLFEQKGNILTAKCPAIMGSFYSHLHQKKYTNFPTVIIDFCLFTDKEKVLKGADVAIRLFHDCEENLAIVPIFCNQKCSKMSPYAILLNNTSK
jgi:hypothetical protein